VIRPCSVFLDVCFVLFLFCLHVCAYALKCKVHCGSASVRRFRASLLLHTTCYHSCCTCSSICVVAKPKKKVGGSMSVAVVCTAVIKNLHNALYCHEQDQSKLYALRETLCDSFPYSQSHPVPPESPLSLSHLFHVLQTVPTIWLYHLSFPNCLFSKKNWVTDCHSTFRIILLTEIFSSKYCHVEEGEQQANFHEKTADNRDIPSNTWVKGPLWRAAPLIVSSCGSGKTHIGKAKVADPLQALAACALARAGCQPRRTLHTPTHACVVI
jgi:hypothetical protein